MAQRYLITGGTGIWTSTSNWSSTSGGVSGSTAPTASDDVFFISTSNNAPIKINAIAAVLSLSADSYSGVFEMNNQLSVSSGLTLSSGMTFSTSGGTPILRTVTGNGTFRSNGKEFPYNLLINTAGALTCTLVDDWTVGSLTLNNGSATNILNGNNLYVKGNLTENTSVAKNGTTNIYLIGTGNTWTNTSTGSLNIPLTIAGTYNITGTTRHASTLTFSGTAIINHSGILVKTGPLINNAPNLILDSVTFGTNNNNISGNFGITFNNYTMIIGSSVGFKTGNTYTINNNFNSTASTLASPAVMSSTTVGVQAIVNLNVGAFQRLSFVNATDLDSSQGQTIYSFKGVLSNATNWSLLTAPTTITSFF